MYKTAASPAASPLRCRPVARAFAQSGARDVARELLKVIEDTDLGVRTTPNQKSAIQTLVQQLKQHGQGQETTGDDMTATWKMKWTSEKETLFILKYCTWFNKTPGDVYQVIDRRNQKLQNAVVLDPESLFMVDSTIEVASPQRVNFQFTSALYREADRQPLKLPPFGRGWFDNIYIDDEIRVAIDIRKDTLITVRDGPPRGFL